jgi:Carboxypeptidase regulatory-like domain/TonB dependent receptor
MRLSRLGVVVGLLLLCVSFSYRTLRAQTTAATVGGQITDQQGRVVMGARVVFTNINTGLLYSAETNGQGIYTLASLQPGVYRANVTKEGFKGIVKSSIELHVQDQVSLNFALQVGSVSEVVTVEGGAPSINTVDAAVSTIVDRNFAENLPMNGRSFQTLIQLTPGVVLTAANNLDTGQFSVNGQRANSNYWTVDGVSANIGMSAAGLVGSGLGGGLPSFSVQGGTNSLVSVDAMQEFRIQTSTYAPEFGRSPGGQVSIVTRSGTKQFHGAAFDYLRNDILDANDWFADHNSLPKPEERQNDFGGTLSGPLRKDSTFFFFSYEGLRLRLPEVAQTLVPDLAARQSASSSIQPFLNAFPLPNGADNPSNGAAQFNSGFSNASTLDAYSLRVDHRPRSNITLFGRYNYSPSELLARGPHSTALSELERSRIVTQTGTLGAIWNLSSRASDDLRFNYSKTSSTGKEFLDNFGGAVPPSSLPFPTPFSVRDSVFEVFVFSLAGGTYQTGHVQEYVQRQINLIDSISVQKSTHLLKFGMDYRRLAPFYGPSAYGQDNFFNDVPSLVAGNLAFSANVNLVHSTLFFHNLGAYAQDTWRIGPRLSATYGLRWDVDFAPSSDGANLPAVTGFDLTNLSKLGLLPPGTQPFHTSYGNLAPRLGIAYGLSNKDRWPTVLRGGVGLFYDLATSEVGNLISSAAYPFGGFALSFGGTFPLSPAAAAPPAIAAPGGGEGTLTAYDPNIRLPYTLEWNFALEQGLGKQQEISVSYIGAAGSRLLQTADISPAVNFATARLVANTASSDYDGLQLQFERQLSHGFQALASYTWAHSIDDGSSGSYANTANTLVPSGADANRGPSDFDIRHAVSAGLTYNAPTPNIPFIGRVVFGGWSLQNIVQVRSSVPVNVFDSTFTNLLNASTEIRPDGIMGQAFYLFGSQYPGGKAFNAAAFQDPPIDPNTGLPVRQGNVPRNFLRGFGAAQWDFAVHRDFPIHESLKLQFRAEMFNVLNHPNFGQPVGDLGDPSEFGLSTQMLGQSLTGPSLGAGGLNPLYQIGGPRSIQLALKLSF